MKGQLAGLMKQAQQMQEEQQKLALIEGEGTAGAGLVKVVMSCNHALRRVSIDPSVLDEDKEMLEDLVAAAFNDALRKASAAAEEEIGSIASALSLPSGFKLPC